jgi:hypothetical protein
MSENFSRQHKYKIYLKEEVSKYDLIKHGFEIEEDRMSTWAVKNKNVNKKMLIIRLDPPDRRLMYRYQASENEFDLLEEIKDMMEIFEVR